MKLSTLNIDGRELAAICTENRYIAIESLNASLGTSWPIEMLELIASGALQSLREWYNSGGREQLAGVPSIYADRAVLAPLYRNPGKIWGIGMNYVQDAAELEQKAEDEEPVGFMKPATTLIGPGQSIVLPEHAGTITAEAELAIVIEKTCRNVTEEEAPEMVAGITTALDMTAFDIHGRNPRFLARAKSYDTFLSIGSQLLTLEDIPDILDVTVTTGLNGEKLHTNRIFNMKFRPWYTVAFHSAFMTLHPGDIIITGTPGAVVIRDGDVAVCYIDGLEPLVNPVEGMAGLAR
jgi:2-keto-4-pentenoate hydratase/2-oxohepta-3-ene-1,7-dioic acid hydratase in catechol pathway